MDLLVGGRLAATMHMSKLLLASRGMYTWENYGRSWETDHYPFKMKNVDFMNEKSMRQTHHYLNLRPWAPYSNKCDRHGDGDDTRQEHEEGADTSQE
jgi:hypothetical protein